MVHTSNTMDSEPYLYLPVQQPNTWLPLTSDAPVAHMSMSMSTTSTPTSPSLSTADLLGSEAAPALHRPQPFRRAWYTRFVQDEAGESFGLASGTTSLEEAETVGRGAEVDEKRRAERRGSGDDAWERGGAERAERRR